MLIEYVRNKKREKIGVLVALPSKNGFSIGWSKCNTSKNDKFDRDLGLILAIGRANLNSSIYVRDKRKLVSMPRQIRQHCEERFRYRASRYYNKEMWSQLKHAQPLLDG